MAEEGGIWEIVKSVGFGEGADAGEREESWKMFGILDWPMEQD